MNKIFYIILTSIAISQISDNTYIGAEATALSGTMVSQQNGSESIFYNPAGISNLESMQFSMGGGNLYGFHWLPAYYINGVLPISGMGNIGFAIQNFETKTKSGKQSLSSEQTVSIAQGINLQKDKNSHLAIGYSANFIQWDLGKSSGISGNGSDGIELGNIKSLTIDFGIQASLREKFWFGASTKNITSDAIGKGITRSILPRKINIGISYKPISDLVTSFSAERLIGRKDLQIRGAICFHLNPIIELYSGAQSNPNRIGFGFKLFINNPSKSKIKNNYNNFIEKKYNLTISYGLLTHPILPLVQQLSIGFEL